VPAPFPGLVVILWATAVVLLLAFAGAALPESWMGAAYEFGGLGPWRVGPPLA